MERVYDAPYEDVWSACIRVANEKDILGNINKNEGLLYFAPKRTWAQIAVTVISIDANHTKLVLNRIVLQYSPFTSNGKDAPKKYLDAVGEELKAKPTP